jgi:hypothetical protein
MKKLLLLAAALVTVTAAHATHYTTNFNWSVNQTVPDNNYSGWVNSQSISGHFARQPAGVAGTDRWLEWRPVCLSGA